MSDPRITEYNIDVEAEARSRKQLEEMGITKPDDVQQGRIDFGRAAQLLTSGPETVHMSPILAEKVDRDREFAQMAAEQTPQDQADEESGQEPDRLTLLQQELDAQRSEAARWKTLYGRSEDRRGKEEKLRREQMSRMAPLQPYVDARQLTGKNPDDVPTVQDISTLMMNLAAALGNQIREAKEEAIKEARSPEEARIPVEVETELAEKYPWLAELTVSQKERAIMDLIGVQPGSQSPMQSRQVSQAKPKLPSSAELGRARVRDAGFIEPSNRGSSAERSASTPANQALNAKVAEYREAINKPGGSAKAAEILASLGAGLTDDREAQFGPHRR